MGTNYFAVPKVGVVENITNRLLNIQVDKIHIGKQSMGWQFMFNHNNWEHFHDFETMTDFIREHTIINECGEELNYHDFWKMVAAHQGLDNFDTFEKNPQFNVDASDVYLKGGDEYHFGFRFFTGTDFS